MEILPTPSALFCERLHRFDPSLSLNWDQHHGVWSIWSIDPYTGQRDHVMNVVEDDGSYRELDNRVFMILERNRYYASHPEELIKKFVDPIEEERKKADEKDRDNIRHLAADKTLNRMFQETVEKARSIPWEKWATPKKFKSEDGHTLTWMPPSDLKNSSKPTDNEADQYIKWGQVNEDL